MSSFFLLHLGKSLPRPTSGNSYTHPRTAIFDDMNLSALVRSLSADGRNRRMVDEARGGVQSQSPPRARSRSISHGGASPHNNNDININNNGNSNNNNHNICGDIACIVFYL